MKLLPIGLKETKTHRQAGRKRKGTAIPVAENRVQINQTEKEEEKEKEKEKEEEEEEEGNREKISAARKNVVGRILSLFPLL